MNDDQTDPECVLLLLMERKFRGPEYENAQTRDWRAHMARVLQCVRENDPMIAGLRWHVEALDRACRMALEALTLVTDAGEDEAERWSVSGGAYEGVKCVAAINAIRAAIPMPHEELADGWCVPEVKE